MCFETFDCAGWCTGSVAGHSTHWVQRLQNCVVHELSFSFIYMYTTYRLRIFFRLLCLPLSQWWHRVMDTTDVKKLVPSDKESLSSPKTDVTVVLRVILMSPSTLKSLKFAADWISDHFFQTQRNSVAWSCDISVLLCSWILLDKWTF